MTSYLIVQEDSVDETPPGVISRGTATVALSDESQTLNLRAAPTTNAAVLSRLRHGQTLTVLERYANWTYVQYGTLSGYVMNDYVVYDAGDSDSDTPNGGGNSGENSGENGGGQAAAQVAIVLPSDGLNLRAGANTASGVIMVLPQGTMLTVTGEMRDNGMLPVLLGSVAGYVSSDYVYVTDEESIHLPNRGTIIGIIKDLRRVVFPGYFGDENISSTMPGYFLGNMLTHIYEEMRTQIEIAFLYDDKSASSREEITEKARDICERFISRLPYIQKMLLMDVQAGFDGDPAAKSKEDIIFSYPGLFAIYVYRIAHELYVQNVPFIPRIMTEYAHGKTGIDINSGANIGRYFFIDHGTGIVIGETTEIGDYVKLYQGVTLGALSTRKGQQLSGKKRHPTIGDHVTIYANSTILGGETVIGCDSIIGGNSFITESVPAHTRVSIKSPELTLS